ncbi:hypothetical protein N9T73_00030 [bacterium]|nr:hypothetical protein [bacterium]
MELLPELLATLVLLFLGLNINYSNKSSIWKSGDRYYNLKLKLFIKEIQKSDKLKKYISQKESLDCFSEPLQQINKELLKNYNSIKYSDKDLIHFFNIKPKTFLKNKSMPDILTDIKKQIQKNTNNILAIYYYKRYDVLVKKIETKIKDDNKCTNINGFNLISQLNMTYTKFVDNKYHINIVQDDWTGGMRPYIFYFKIVENVILSSPNITKWNNIKSNDIFNCFNTITNDLLKSYDMNGQSTITSVFHSKVYRTDKSITLFTSYVNNKNLNKLNAYFNEKRTRILAIYYYKRYEELVKDVEKILKIN